MLLGAAVMVGFGNDGHLSGDLLAFFMTNLMALRIARSRRFPGLPTLHAGIVSSFAGAVISLPFAGTLNQASHQLILLATVGLINSSMGFALFALGSHKIVPIDTVLLGA